MIPRLSGFKGAVAPQSNEASTLPTRMEAQKVIKQFFSLIEHFQIPEAVPAPETKQSIRRKPKGRRANGSN